MLKSLIIRLKIFKRFRYQAQLIIALLAQKTANLARLVIMVDTPTARSVSVIYGSTAIALAPGH